MKRLLFLSLLFLLTAGALNAQYFGRNKPRYEKQDFKVTQTEHFEIYEYLNNPEKLKELAAAAELWYDMHQAALHDTLKQKNPLVIYSDHAGFQQTNVIQGDISVGTGGVTEGLRNRVVFPVAMTNQQTNHVLGHEMVHAFQYHMILEGDSTSMRNLGNLPLWMIEGLAEYLSIGRVDAHTALWMRDAVQHNDLPTIDDLNSYKYFPYRWGQAFWAFITGVYGDEVIPVYFKNTAKYGLEAATKITLSTTTDSLSVAWHSVLRNHYGRWVGLDKEAIAVLEASEKDKKSKEKKEARDKLLGKLGKSEKMPGKKLFDDDAAGNMTISPVLSPNGKYVIFLSEKNLFTTDLFLAEAKSGKVLKKVASTSSDGHIDQFNFLESAGTWSPNDKQFAFDVYEKGRSVLVIQDVFKGKTVKKITIPGVHAFSNPAWSPDGKTIVVSGLVNGQTDLYAYDLKTKKVRQLTNDKAAEIQATWSADGKFLAYSTDHISLERGRSNGAWTMNLALMNMENAQVNNLDIFPGADNLNPQFDKAGNLFFLSNRDGFRNMYRYDPATQKLEQLTKLSTGITGITPYAPAITVAEDRDRVLYTYYSNGTYKIYQAQLRDFQPEEVSPMAVDMVPATLPPFAPGRRDVVNTNLRLMENNIKTSDSTTTLTPVKYKPKFSLEYLGGSAGVGVATGNRSFGNVAGGLGGIDMLFGDMLGNNQLYIGAALNGELQDAAFQASYINRKNPIGWGVGLGHIPFITGGGSLPLYVEPLTPPQGGYNVAVIDELLVQRQFLQQINGFVFYPFSVTKRVELGGSTEFYSIRNTSYKDVYAGILDSISGNLFIGPLIDQVREKGDRFGPVGIYSVNAAFVGDNSHFGFTAPLKGWRYRIAVEQYMGSYWRFTGLLLDGRRYFYQKPFTFAVRGLAYGRFGGNQDEGYENGDFKVQPLFVAQPWFVRGYPYDLLYDEQRLQGLIEMGSGSKMLLANAEIRLPFTGPKQLALIGTNFLVSDLNLFFDAGLAFFKENDLKKNPVDPDPNNGQDPVRHKPLLSAGISLRVNLFGALVLEPYFALPLTVPKERREWVWGLNFIPGW
ncbi:MAG: PD40 domain-containing protein [Lewinellaceae bacterium]|nr:PD40 domain-containing protein [Lewinellaceae bacterium]